MSTLWTPDGEHRVDRSDDPGTSRDPDVARARPGATPPQGGPAGGPAGGPDGGPLGTGGEPEDEAAVAARLAELRGQLVSTPVEVVVANHAYGLFELAAIHLSEQPPRLEQARLAIDALGALVEGLAGRLGEAEKTLVDAMAQLRLAYVQVQGAAAGEQGAGPGPEPAT